MIIRRISLALASLLFAASSNAVLIASESFGYYDETMLAGGVANDGSGWSAGWDAVSGGGLEVFNDRIDQVVAAGSTRALANPFPLSEPDDYYFSFFARTDANGAFQFNLKQTSPEYVRWAFSRHADGSITLQGGAVSTNSASGVFEGDREYLIISKFETTGDIAYVKLLDPENPGTYTNEPVSWDLVVAGGTGVTIDRLDINVTAGGVEIDEFKVGTTYADVVGLYEPPPGNSNTTVLASESFEYNTTVGGTLLDGTAYQGGTGWSTTGSYPYWVATVGSGLLLDDANGGAGSSLGGTNSVGNRAYSVENTVNVRSLATGFALNSDYYTAFLARTDSAGAAFSVEFSYESPTKNIRWKPFGLNSDGTIETTAGTVEAVSSSSLWSTGVTYLVVSKWEGDGDHSYTKIFDVEAGTNYLTEVDWENEADVHADGLSGTTILDVYLSVSSGGVEIDEFKVGATYEGVLGLPEVQSDKPNILFFITDDESWLERSAYGRSVLPTPAFDRVARDGVLFTRAFATAPSCAPARASVLTGRSFWEMKQGGFIQAYIPKAIPVFPEILEESGYHVGWTGRGWKPGVNLEDSFLLGPVYNGARVTNPPESILNFDYAANFDLFLADRHPDEPFFFWAGPDEPHAGYGATNYMILEQETGFSPDDVVLPPDEEDTLANRRKWASFYFEIRWADDHLARMLASLEAIGELSNTLVVVTSDNGTAYGSALHSLRGKASPYDYGVHEPLAIMWPNRCPAGRTVTDFVDFSDFAPTFLEAAGCEIPAGVSGRSLLPMLETNLTGRIEADRDSIVTGLEWHGEFDPESRSHRTFRDDQYAYILRYKNVDDLGEPLNNEQLTIPSSVEFYDLINDPWQMTNVAGVAAYAADQQRLADQLYQTGLQRNDPRVTGNMTIFRLTRQFVQERKLAGYPSSGIPFPSYTNFTEWVEEEVGNPVDAAFSADPEGDRITNGEEYFYALDPLQTNDYPWRINPMQDGISLTYDRANDLTDVVGETQWSPDLVHWYSSGETASNLTVYIVDAVDSSNPAKDVITSTPVPGGTVPEALFLRVKVSGN